MSLSSFIWSVADLLRGDYKQSEYGKVILAFTSCGCCRMLRPSRKQIGHLPGVQMRT